MDKLLTIAIPTYNRANLLDRLLKAIKPQLCEEMEVLVSDNASTDNTKELIAEKYPFVQYYQNTENIGSNRNFMECYKRANGKYVWLVGSDDVVKSGSIGTILGFISVNAKEDMPVIFLNHDSFEGEYANGKQLKNPFLDVGCGNHVLKEKKEFMSFAGKQLTFMSAFLLSKRVFLEAENPEQYFETHFFHTCIAFTAKVTEKSRYGIIGYVCVSQDLTVENVPFTDNYETLFEIFGKWMKYVYVYLAPKYGYSQRQMKTIYIHAMRRFFLSWTIRMKAKNIDKEKKAFWRYCYPAIKEFPISWITTIPVAVLPRWVSIMALKFKNR